MTLSMEKSRDFIKTHEEKTDPWRFVRRDKRHNKQLEMMENALSRYGLSMNEIRIYLYLARTNGKKAAEIAEAVSLHRTETYRVIRHLEKRGIILSALERPLKFTAVPLEKAIEQLIDAQKMQIKLLEKEKPDLLQLWSSMPKSRIEDGSKEIFQILEGEPETILKADELLDKAQTEVQIFAPDGYLALLYHSDFMDDLQQHSYNLNIRLLTENSLKSRFFCEQIGWANHKYCLDDVKNMPYFMISDRKELLTVYRKNIEDRDRGSRKKSRIVALWTNCNALVEIMLMLFSRLSKTKEIREQNCVAYESKLGLEMEDGE